MYKCCASQDGICRNAMLYGTNCDGYKERCILRPHYQNLKEIQENAKHAVRKAFGAED